MVIRDAFYLPENMFRCALFFSKNEGSIENTGYPNRVPNWGTYLGTPKKQIYQDSKILNVNEGIGEALFYPYNVLVNKCSGSCDTLDNPMPKICVPKIIKNVNMKVYNFLMRLNETRNVLWHES